MVNRKTSPQRRKDAKIAKTTKGMTSLSALSLWITDMSKNDKSQPVDFLCGTLRSLRLCGEQLSRSA
jgi:hypothetical protein